MKITQVHLPEITEEKLHDLAILQGKTTDEIVKDAIDFYLDSFHEFKSKSIDRRAFLKLPMTERRRILAEQAEAMVEHYQQDTSWQEWVNLDLGVSDDQ